MTGLLENFSFVYWSLSKNGEILKGKIKKNEKIKSPIFQVVLNYFINTGMGE